MAGTWKRITGPCRKLFFEEMLRLLQKMLDFEHYNVKTHRNEAFQPLGVLKNDSSWSKAAWNMFQSLFWWENRWLTIENTEAGNLYFFKNRWKPSQKMRLDALIIFHIEWRHHVSSSVGKQSKYWSKKARPKIMCFFKNGWKPSQKTRLDALIIFHIEWQHQVSSLADKQSKYWSKKGKTENH